MFHDVDETLRRLFVDDVPIRNGEVDIAFERPDREWSGRISKPTLNLFLHDIRENTSLRRERLQTGPTGDGRVTLQRPPRRIDLTYLITAWTKESEDEHRILARVLAAMYRHGEIGDEYLQGDLADADVPVCTCIAKPDQLVKPHDLWSVLDNEVHVSLSWTVTAPLDVFRPMVGSLVRTAEVAVSRTGGEWAEVIRHIGGLVHAKGDTAFGIPNASVSLVGTGFETTTDADGRYRFTNVADGAYDVVVDAPDGKPETKRIVVPSEGYDIELTHTRFKETRNKE